MAPFHPFHTHRIHERHNYLHTFAKFHQPHGYISYITQPTSSFIAPKKFSLKGTHDGISSRGWFVCRLPTFSGGFWGTSKAWRIARSHASEISEKGGWVPYQIILVCENYSGYWFQPHLKNIKYISKWEIFSQIGVNIKNVWIHHPVIVTPEESWLSVITKTSIVVGKLYPKIWHHNVSCIQCLSKSILP